MPETVAVLALGGAIGLLAAVAWRIWRGMP